MRRFIFKKPFVSKRKKALGKAYLELAQMHSVLARGEIAYKDGSVTDEYRDHLMKMSRCQSKAAKCFGFRNLRDMDDYYKVHGHY